MSEIPSDAAQAMDTGVTATSIEQAHLSAIVRELMDFRREIVLRVAECQETVVAIREALTSLAEDTSRKVDGVHHQINHILQGVASATKLPRPAARLSKVVSVVYGAVLSYALYALADSIVIHGIVEAMAQHWQLNIVVDMCVRIMLFVPVLLFLVKHLGDVVMIETRFPAKRELRYLYEVVAASFYLCTFALLGRGSFFALFTFAVVLFVSGIWASEVRKEYRRHPCKISQLARTLRALNYIGCAIFLVLIGVIWFFRDQLKYDQLPWVRARVAAGVVIVFFLWYVAYERVPRKLHGRFVRRYLLSYVKVGEGLRPKSWFGDGRVQ